MADKSRLLTAVVIASFLPALAANPHGPRGQLVSWGRVVVPPVASDATFSAVATGIAHTIVLGPDGTVTGWGSNASGQLSIPHGLSDVVAIAAGGYDSMALRADGTVIGWGENRIRFSTLFPSWTNVKSISMALRRAIALREDGTILEWAGRSSGTSSVPMPSNLTNVIAVAAGGRHSLAILSDRTVAGWGYNFTSQAIPPANATNAISIAAGESYSMVMREDRTVIGWGTIDFVVSNVVHMTAGPMVATVVRNDGVIRQIGVSGVQTNRVDDPAAVKQISAGEGFYMVLKGDGTLIGKGTNDYLQAMTPRDFQDAIEVSGYGDTRSGASLNTQSFLALLGNGTVVGSADSAFADLRIPAGLSNIASIAAADTFSVALRRDGTVKAWGDNSFRQTSVPVDLTNVAAISARGSHALALRTDGSVTGWGRNLSGETIAPTGASNVIAVAAGISHSMALRADGQVICWGANSYKQTNTPPSVSNIVAIAAGNNHNLALRNDGSILAWGDNTYNQTAVPSELSGAVRIFAGANHSAALLGNGSVVAWGATNIAMIPSGSTNREIVAISSIYGQSMAIVQSRPQLEIQSAPGGNELSFWGFQGNRYFLEQKESIFDGPWIESTSGGVEGKWGWNRISQPMLPLPEYRFFRLRSEVAN